MIARRVGVCLDKEQDDLLMELRKTQLCCMMSYSEILRMFFLESAREFLKKQQESGKERE